VVIIQYLGQNVKDYLENFLYTGKIPLSPLCPCCGHEKLIRWGFFRRLSFSIEKTIRIQRVRCKKCHKTSSLVPTFLVPYKSVSMFIIQDFVNSYVYTDNSIAQICNDSQVTKELDTLYRWMKNLIHNARQYTPFFLSHLLHLNSESAVPELIALIAHQSNRKAQLLAFIAAADYLLQESHSLLLFHTFSQHRILEFISYLLWKKHQVYLLSKNLQ